VSIKRITPEEAKRLLDSNSGYIYLDVRTVQEFEQGHVPGAKNVPVAEPDDYGRMAMNPRFVAVVEKRFGKAAKIISGCQSGMRSLKAAQILEGAGFSNVVDMRGGFGGERDQFGQLSTPGWGASGFPIANESSPEDQYEKLAEE